MNAEKLRWALASFVAVLFHIYGAVAAESPSGKVGGVVGRFQKPAQEQLDLIKKMAPVIGGSLVDIIGLNDKAPDKLDDLLSGRIRGRPLAADPGSPDLRNRL